MTQLRDELLTLPPAPVVFGGDATPLETSPAWKRYGFAMAITVIAVLVRAALDPIMHDKGPLMLSTLAVLVVAWFAGLGPGVFATIVGVGAGAYLFHDPLYSWIVNPGDRIRLGMALAEGFAISGVCHVMHRARRNVERQARTLRHKRELLRDSLENAVVGVHWVDPDGKVTWTNRAELDMLGYSWDQYVGRHISEFHADCDAIEDILRRLSSGESLKNYEARMRCKDGSIRHVLINSNVLWEDGRFVHTRCFTQDITHRKQAEQALVLQNAILECQSEASPDGILVVDRDGKILSFNRRFVEIWRIPEHVIESRSDEAALNSVRDMLANPDEFMARVAYLYQHPDEESSDEIHLKDGRTLDRYSCPVRDRDGTHYGRVWFFRDVTKQKRDEEHLRSAKEELEIANQAKDQFLAALSHELRTPLTPVLMTVSALRQRKDLPREVANDLAMLHRNVELEARLIDDLLDLTRIARGKLELRRELTDVHSVLDDAVRVCCTDSVQARRITVTTELTARRRGVWGDPSRLEQIFWNLINNAIKFSRDGGHVIVRSADVNDNLRVEVIDDGVGIDPELLPRLFNAFEQGGARVTRRFGGLGLGLSISRALVERHGGTLCAHSDGVGRGATFNVELPAVDIPTPESDDSIAPIESQSSSRCLQILLVEDHRDTAKALGKLLRASGYQVWNADGVGTALELAERRKGEFDLIVSDLGLPDGSGLELMQRLRRRYGLKGICLSGYGMHEDIMRSLNAGFAEHLTKPVDLMSLKAAIERLATRDEAQMRG